MLRESFGGRSIYASHEEKGPDHQGLSLVERDFDKLRTGKTATELMQLTGCSFNELFGMSAEMKAFEKLSTQSGRNWGKRWGIQDLEVPDSVFVEMTAYARSLARNYPLEDVHLLTLAYFREKYLTDEETENSMTFQEASRRGDVTEAVNFAPAEVREEAEALVSAFVDETDELDADQMGKIAANCFAALLEQEGLTWDDFEDGREGVMNYINWLVAQELEFHRASNVSSSEKMKRVVMELYARVLTLKGGRGKIAINQSNRMGYAAKSSPTIIELPEEDATYLKELLSHERSDSLLNIGDPFEALGKELDGRGIDTLDYSPGIVQEHYDIRTASEVLDNVSGIYSGSTRYRGYSDHMQEVHEMTEMGLVSEYDEEWFARADTAVQQAIEATQEAGNNPDSINNALEAWRGVRSLMTERKGHYIQQELDPSNPAYDTEGGLSPVDSLFRTMNSMEITAVNGLRTVEAYRKDVLPEIYYRYLENILEAHIASVSNTEKGEYVDLWKGFLHTQGIDSNTFDDRSAPELIKLMGRFLQEKGTQMLRMLDENLYHEILDDELDELGRQVPFVSQTKNSRTIVGTYPFTEDILEPGYDRILASWSITAHSMPRMGEDEIRRVWEETDRLLASGGRATFFPIGYAGNSKEQIDHTLEEYTRSSQSSIQWQWKGEQGEVYGGLALIIIK